MPIIKYLNIANRSLSLCSPHIELVRMWLKMTLKTEWKYDTVRTMVDGEKEENGRRYQKLPKLNDILVAVKRRHLIYIYIYALWY